MHHKVMRSSPLIILLLVAIGVVRHVECRDDDNSIEMFSGPLGAPETSFPEMLGPNSTCWGYVANNKEHLVRVLMLSVTHGLEDCIVHLLSLNPDRVLDVDGHGNTALMSAAFHGRLGSTALLLLHRPEEQVAAINGMGHDALSLAASRGHSDIVKTLIMMCPSCTRATAKLLAGMMGHDSIVRLLS